jgi:hypothetical protein
LKKGPCGDYRINASGSHYLLAGETEVVCAVRRACTKTAGRPLGWLDPCPSIMNPGD